MNFYFDSAAEFFHMNGHGPYVWFCYVVTFAVLGLLAAWPVVKSRRFKRQQRALARRRAAQVGGADS